MSDSAAISDCAPSASPVKCVVWDLDHTLWDGVLLECPTVRLRPGIREALEVLDSRGILLSIASRNDAAMAMAKLKELDVDQYFLYPQINWNRKSSSIKNIAASLNIGLDTFALIDDQPFEREEVMFSLPQVECIDATDLSRLSDMPRMMPRFITEDSRQRRAMYLSDARRNEAQAEFVGSSDEFLATLGMRFSIGAAREDDLKRAEELTVRTHQLNTTGYSYSYEELDAFRRSLRHELLIAALDDKYGSYGKIGLALIEHGECVWTVKLLLMSCRVMARGVGSVLLNHIMHSAKEAGVRLRAEFVPNDVNRMMYVTYKFAGFQEVGVEGRVHILENALDRIHPHPAHTTVILT